MFDNCVIMAGGSGTRLWPASSSRLPKQFLPASESSSFFGMAVERALALTGKVGWVIVIAGKKHIPHVITDISGLNEAEKKRVLVIAEPAAKSTAPAIACSVVYSLLCGGGNTIVLTSDHVITPLEAFESDAALAAKAASDGKLVVFGIPSSGPNTGYGYIEAEKSVSDVFNVSAFHEKPDLKTAKKYDADRHFFWNSGMFAFDSRFLADKFRELAPEVFLHFEKLKAPKPSGFKITDGVNVLTAWNGLEAAYSKTLDISFDYAIAEKCENTVMIRANFDWIDIGNWDEYIKIRSENNSQVYRVSGDSCYVDSDIPVALAGVEDLIIVIRSGKNGKPASALITRKGETQKVRDVVELIKKSGKTELL